MKPILYCFYSFDCKHPTHNLPHVIWQIRLFDLILKSVWTYSLMATAYTRTNNFVIIVLMFILFTRYSSFRNTLLCCIFKLKLDTWSSQINDTLSHNAADPNQYVFCNKLSAISGGNRSDPPSGMIGVRAVSLPLGFLRADDNRFGFSAYFIPPGNRVFPPRFGFYRLLIPDHFPVPS